MGLQRSCCTSATRARMFRITDELGTPFQWRKAVHTISEIINLIKAATHPSKHPGGHEMLASLPSLL